MLGSPISTKRVCPVPVQVGTTDQSDQGVASAVMNAAVLWLGPTGRPEAAPVADDEVRGYKHAALDAPGVQLVLFHCHIMYAD